MFSAPWENVFSSAFAAIDLPAEGVSPARCGRPKSFACLSLGYSVTTWPVLNGIHLSKLNKILLIVSEIVQERTSH